MIVRAGLLSLVLVTAVLFETVVLADLQVLGYAPMVVVLTVVGVALVDGGESGARYGFAAGLLVDMLGGSLLGMNTIVFVLVGWGVGAIRPYLTGPLVLIRLMVGATASALAVAGYGMLTFLLDPGALTATILLQAVVVTGLYSGALAPFVAGPVAALVQRVPVAGAATR